MEWTTEMRGGLVKVDCVRHVNNIHLQYSKVTYNTQSRHIFFPRYIYGHREEGRKILGNVIICGYISMLHDMIDQEHSVH